MIPGIHQDLVRLKRFADGECDPKERAKVVRHLEACTACRSTVLRLRELSKTLRAMEVPRLSADGIDRVLLRRRNGERVLLPVLPTRRRVKSTQRYAAGLAMMAMVVLGIVLAVPWQGLRAETHGGELRWAPEHPVAGAQLTLEYRPGPDLAAAGALRLRAQLFPEQGVSVTESVDLLRGRGDVFRGSLLVPEGTVFILIAVEDSAGSMVDARGGTPWDVVVHDASGRPTAAGLKRRVDALRRTNWESAHRSARLFTQLYPDDPWGWRTLLGQEIELAGPAKADSLRAAYRPQFQRMNELYLGREQTDPDDIWHLIMLASDVREREAAQAWRARGLRDHPRDPGMIQQRVFQFWIEGREGRTLLEGLDSLYRVGGEHTPQVLMDGWALAVESGEVAEIETWGNRVVRQSPEYAGQVGYRWMGIPQLEAAGRRLITSRLDTLAAGGGAERPLTMEQRRWERSRNQERQNLMMLLARADLSNGNVGTALQNLQLASTLTPDGRVEKLLGDALIAAGDTSRALRSYARAYADPRVPATLTDSVRLHTGGLPAEWERWVAEADAELRRDLVATALPREASRAVTLADAAGAEVMFTPGQSGRISIVAFLSRLCSPSNAQAPRLQSVADAFASWGVELVAITSEVPSTEAVEGLRQRGLTAPVLFDTHARARSSFRSFGTPHFFVLDASGRVRFEARSADELPALIAVLADRPLREAAAALTPPRRRAAPASSR